MKVHALPTTSIQAQTRNPKNLRKSAFNLRINPPSIDPAEVFLRGKGFP